MLNIITCMYDLASADHDRVLCRGQHVIDNNYIFYAK